VSRSYHRSETASLRECSQPRDRASINSSTVWQISIIGKQVPGVSLKSTCRSAVLAGVILAHRGNRLRHNFDMPAGIAALDRIADP